MECFFCHVLLLYFYTFKLEVRTWNGSFLNRVSNTFMEETVDDAERFSEERSGTVFLSSPLPGVVSESTEDEGGDDERGVAVSRPFLNRDAVNCAKGLCTLGVLTIHSNGLRNTYFYNFVVNRSVRVFMFLFGVTSETWWERSSPRDGGIGGVETWYAYYQYRFRRLLPKWWCALMLWEFSGCAKRTIDLFVLANRSMQRINWPLALMGFNPHWGTSWFVSEIIVLTALFPMMRQASLKAWYNFSSNAVVALVGTSFNALVRKIKSPGAGVFSNRGSTGALEALFHSTDMLHGIEVMEPFQYAGSVSFGMWYARHGGTVSEAWMSFTASLIYAASVLSYALCAQNVSGLILGVLQNSIDVSLSFIVMLVSNRLARVRNDRENVGTTGTTAPGLWALSRVARGLEALGKGSWGFYLGHIVFYECMFYKHPKFLSRMYSSAPAGIRVALLLAFGKFFDDGANGVIRLLSPADRT